MWTSLLESAKLPAQTARRDPICHVVPRSFSHPWSKPLSGLTKRGIPVELQASSALRNSASVDRRSTTWVCAMTSRNGRSPAIPSLFQRFEGFEPLKSLFWSERILCSMGLI
jgi:hypothetical protein